MKIQLPGGGRSVDAIIAEAFASFGCKPLGGQSGTGWSKQSDFQRCPRRYQLKHELGATPLVVGEVAPSLDIGAVGHVLLAVHYAAMMPDDRYPGWQPNLPEPHALLEAMLAAGLPGEIYMVVQQCLDGYLERWAGEDIRPMAVEYSAGDAKFHTSRFDLVCYTEEGLHPGLWIGEHKFLKRGTDLEEYRLHGEILGEMLSWQLSGLDDFFGLPLAGVCLNVIFKPTKTLLPTFQRLWLPVPPPEHIQRYATDRVFWLKLLMECKQRFGSAPWPRALLGCKKYKLCRYFEHCRSLDAGQLQFKDSELPSIEDEE